MRTDFRDYALGITKFAVFCSIIASSFLVARSSLIISYPHISTAITIDLLITLPLVYLLFIHKSSVPKLTVFPVFVFAVILASLILPANDRYFLELAILYAIPVVEAVALIFVGSVIYRSRKSYRSFAEDGNDFIERLRKVLVKELSVQFVARAAAFEIAIFYTAFLEWKRKSGDTVFTYHKRSEVLPLIAVLIGLIVVETVVVHYVVGFWNATVAWILTAVSVYFVIQLFAHAKAIMFRPVEIRKDRLFIRCGLLGDAEIEVINIKNIETVLQPGDDENSVTLSALGGMTPPNMKLELAEEAVLNSFYGIQKRFVTIFITIDEPEVFVSALNKN